MAAVYLLEPEPGSPVSTPIRWSKSLVYAPNGAQCLWLTSSEIARSFVVGTSVCRDSPLAVAMTKLQSGAF